MQNINTKIMQGKKVHHDFPDFFIAGAPKCGTTSLYEWLKSHPCIYMPVKEPSYFSREIRTIPEKNLSEYLAFFSGKRSLEILVGEASPKYLYSDQGLNEIHQLNPEARIIIILRNPVDLVVSFHGQMLKEGMESVADFELAWRLSESRRKGEKIPPRCSWPKLLDYPNWGSIGTRLCRLLEIFPKNQVKILFLDDMAIDPQKAYKDILHHLGLESDGRSRFGVENPKSSIRNIKLHQAVHSLKHKFLPIVNALHSARNGKGLGVFKLVNCFNTKPNKNQSPLNIEFKNELRRYFKHEIQKVAEITARDLSNWLI